MCQWLNFFHFCLGNVPWLPSDSTGEWYTLTLESILSHICTQKIFDPENKTCAKRVDA